MSTRPLSPSERAIWLMDQAACCNGVQTAHLRGVPDLTLLRAGLQRQTVRHPLLRARIDAGGWPRFACEEPALVSLRVVHRRGPESWQEVVEEELNARFDPAVAPLWRAVLVVAPGAPCELILVHHHILADALSAAFQLRELLLYLAEVSAGRPPPEAPELTLRPPLESLLPVRGARMLPAMTHFVLRNAAARLRGWPRKLPLASRPPPSDRRTRLLHYRLSRVQTAALKRRARAAGTSVQGALGAALLLSVAADLQLARPATVGCFSAINLRDRLTEDVGEELGLFVSQATTYHRLSQGRPFWELAREFKGALGRAVSTGEPYMTFPWLGMFVPRGPDPLPGLVRRIDLAMPGAVGITNVGRLPIPQRYGAFFLDRLHIAVNIALFTPLLVAVSTLGGELSCNLIYVEPLIPEGRARAIGDRMFSMLKGRVYSTGTS